jgi:hypothetical protein
MNENLKPLEVITLIPQYANAIYSEGILYFSGAKSISTEARKTMLLTEINLIKEQLANLEQMIG